MSDCAVKHPSMQRETAKFDSSSESDGDAPCGSYRDDDLTPEQKLCAAVLRQAKTDALRGDTIAARFLASRYFDLWCWIGNSNPAVIRRQTFLVLKESCPDVLAQAFPHHFQLTAARTITHESTFQHQ